MFKLSRAGVIFTLAILVGSANEIHAAAPGGAVRIGMIQTMFQDMPEQYLGPMAKRFTSIVKDQTGMSSTLELTPDAQTLARQLKDGKLHLGVFQGFEYAWVMEEFPELAPLAVAVPTAKRFQAILVVHKDSQATGFHDLAGKTIAYPKGNRGHCLVYLKKCQLNVNAEAVNCQIIASPSIGDALEDIVDGKIDATIIDQGVFENFKRVRSGRGAQLKVIDASEEFPLSAVVYRKGILSSSVLTRFRDGLTTAHTSREGQFMMRLWSLSRFSTVPSDYSSQLGRILKAYPPTE